MKETNTSGFTPEKKSRRNAARILSTDEIVNHMRGLFSDNLLKQTTYEGNRRFVERNIVGLKMGKVTCLIADIDHESLDPETRDLITSPRTDIAVVGYFAPDLARHGMYNETNIFAKYEKDNPRLEFAKTLAHTLQQAKKTVAVTDIANRPLYEIMYHLIKAGAGLPLSPIAFLSGRPDLGVGLLFASLVYYFLRRAREQKGEGIFDPDKLSKFERVPVDFEQARRYFVAEGLKKIADNLPKDDPDGPERTIVALYPRAHAIRIADLLVNPRPVVDRLRGLVYKGLAPGLEYSVREYEHDTTRWKLKRRQKLKLLFP